MPDHPICHVEIPAIDPATLSTFYAEVFGWQIQADPSGNRIALYTAPSHSS